MNDYGLLNVLMALFATRIIHIYLTPFRIQVYKHKALCLTVWGIYILFQYLVMVSDAGHPLLILLTNLLLVTLIQLLSCNGDLMAALFRSGFLYASWMAVEVITQNVLLFIGTDGEHFFMIGNVLSKVAIYIAVLLYGRWRGKDNSLPLPFWHWAELFLVPVASVFIIYIAYMFTLRSGTHAAFSVVAVLMILIDCVIFDVYEKLGLQTLVEQQNRAYEQEIRLCENQAAEREEAYLQTRVLRHDLNDHLVAVTALLDAGKTEAAADRIREMMATNSLLKHEISHSGNIALDALVNYKYSSALTEGTVLECRIEVPAELPVDGTDLCVILGNLLDNALEAVRILRAEDRRVKLTVRLSIDTLLIAVENPYSGKVTVDGQGRIRSSKAGDHGIGLISVERTAAKYNGDVSISHENGVFLVSVILPQKEFLPAGQ